MSGLNAPHNPLLKQQLPSIKSNGDNIVSTSTDGKHWTTPITVGTAQDEVFGAIAARDGTIAVASYTRAYDPHGIDLDYAYWSVGRDHRGHRANAADLGSAHINRITTQSENPQVQFVSTDEDGNVYQGVFIGDYTAMTIGTDMTIHPTWTDFRGNPGKTDPNQDAYTQAITLDGRH